jgi:hypothetical protein
MNDIKSVVSVIKILERTIGILENCNDVGEIPDLTRKRIIEMLNKATLEIYFLNNVQTSIVSDEKISENEQETEISEISDTVEEFVPEETYEVQPVLETVVEENIPESIPEEEIVIIPEEESIPEEEMFTEEENVVEIVPEEDTISEDSIFQQEDGFDKPLFEWEIPESEPVQEVNKDDEINMLKLQLEEERKRLELELQNWQEEKRKRDDEMLATQQLLEALQQQAAISRVQQNQTPQPAPQPAIRQTQPVPQSNQSSQQVRQPQQPQQVVKPSHITSEPVKKEESQESTTLLDRFGSKKVLHENFESESVVNQISTPVSSLSKAIGINDKFRFIKELFGGDSDLYNETIKKLDTIGSLVSAISYIESNFSWDKNSDSVKQLISLIRRRYM